MGPTAPLISYVPLTGVRALDIETLSSHNSHTKLSSMQVAKKAAMANTMTINSEASADNTYTYEIVSELASSNAVVLFSMSGCCMCTVAKRLLFGLGVGPTIVELDHHAAGPVIQTLLFQLASDGQHETVPAVFIGGKFLGGIETLMACHINGTLVPLLKEAGALWL